MSPIHTATKKLTANLFPLPMISPLSGNTEYALQLERKHALAPRAGHLRLPLGHYVAPWRLKSSTNPANLERISDQQFRHHATRASRVPGRGSSTCAVSWIFYLRDFVDLVEYMSRVRFREFENR